MTMNQTLSSENERRALTQAEWLLRLAGGCATLLAVRDQIDCQCKLGPNKFKFWLLQFKFGDIDDGKFIL